MRQVQKYCLKLNFKQIQDIVEVKHKHVTYHNHGFDIYIYAVPFWAVKETFSFVSMIWMRIIQPKITTIQATARWSKCKLDSPHVLQLKVKSRVNSSKNRNTLAEQGESVCVFLIAFIQAALFREAGVGRPATGSGRSRGRWLK